MSRMSQYSKVSDRLKVFPLITGEGFTDTKNFGQAYRDVSQHPRAEQAFQMRRWSGGARVASDMCSVLLISSYSTDTYCLLFCSSCCNQHRVHTQIHVMGPVLL